MARPLDAADVHSEASTAPDFEDVLESRAAPPPLPTEAPPGFDDDMEARMAVRPDKGPREGPLNGYWPLDDFVTAGGTTGLNAGGNSATWAPSNSDSKRQRVVRVADPPILVCL